MRNGAQDNAGRIGEVLGVPDHASHDRGESRKGIKMRVGGQGDAGRRGGNLGVPDPASHDIGAKVKRV